MTTEQWLARPMKEVIRNVALAIAEGQEELDRRAIATQREIDRSVEAGDLDYDVNASWLRFAGVDVDLRLAVSLEGTEEVDDEGTVRAYKPVIGVSPLNARSKAEYDLEADLASDVSVRIVPVPPERRTS